MLLDLLSLLGGAVAVFFLKNPRGFVLAVAVGVLLAALCWYGCFAYTRLWNRRFHVKPAHHMLCAVAALITLLFSLLYPALGYVREAGEVSVAAWEATIRRDSVWATATFRNAHQAVRSLGIEDFRGVPPPSSPGSWIPTSHDRSRQEAASTYATSACIHFARSRPFLSKVVWVRPGIPAEVVFEDVHRWHQRNPNYPPERAIGLAVQQIRAGLIAQVPRLVSIFRILAVVVFFLAQGVPFGLVGWAAYRDIKVTA